MATAAASPAAGAMPRPFAVALKHRVSASTMHVEAREERAVGGACSLRLLCSMTSSYESHRIGASAPEVEDEEGPTEYETPPLDGVRSHGACRAAVLELLSAIPAPGPVPLLDPAAGEWYEPVVRDIVGQLLQRATSGEAARGYAFDVSLSIEETFMYVQSEALLLACEQAAATPSSRRTPDERCAVCMERLAPLPATGVDEEKAAAFALPSCGHTFHRGCVAAWFDKGSTCPLCRCDMMYCLVGVQEQLGKEERDGTSMGGTTRGLVTAR